MDKTDLRSIIGILVVLVIAAGVAFAGSQGGYVIFGIPLFTLSLAIAFLINWLAFIPAFILKTEKFYDLTGSISYITVLLVAVFLSPTVDGRSSLLLAMISIWAVRLGSFLFLRIRSAGEDRRFREIKKSFFSVRM